MRKYLLILGIPSIALLFLPYTFGVSPWATVSTKEWGRFALLGGPFFLSVPILIAQTRMHSMRTAALLLFPLFCFCSAGQESSGLHGVVVNSVTGEPISRVQVRLSRHSSLDEPPLPMYVAATDDAGRFSLFSVPPGTYTVGAERTGYFLALPTGKASAIPTATLKPGQQIRDYRMEMSPRSVISGRLLNEDGDPVRGAEIEVEPVPASGGLLYSLGVHGASTNDRGEYSISVPAGFYRIRAITSDYLGDEIRTDGTLPMTYAPTWHPTATSAENAAIVEARAGAESTGADIFLHRIRLSVEGKTTGIPPGAKASVNLECQTGRVDFWVDTTPKPDGAFSFGRLQPGKCHLFAQASSSGRELRSAVVELKLSADAITQLDLALKPGSDISGTLEMADPAEIAGRVVRLESLDRNMGRTYTGSATGDGVFDIKAVAPGRYCVEVQPMPEDSYVKTVTLDGAAVVRGILDLRAGAGAFHVKIATGKGTARISGIVQDASGRPTPAAWAYLVPEGDETLEQERHSMTASDGSYSFSGIAPGHYRLFAWETAGDPEGPLVLANAELVNLKAGDRSNRDLKLLTKETVNARK